MITSFISHILYTNGENKTKPQHKTIQHKRTKQKELIELIDFQNLPVGSSFDEILSSILSVFIFALFNFYFFMVNT